MKYLMLLYADSPMPEPGTPEARRLFDDWAEARQAMTDAGVLIECAPLQPASASTTVRVRGRRDAAHRRAGGGDQGGVRRAHADRV